MNLPKPKKINAEKYVAGLSLFKRKAVKIKLAWSYMSLFVGYCLMFLVNLELVMRMVITLLGGSEHLKPLQTEQTAGFD